MTDNYPPQQSHISETGEWHHFPHQADIGIRGVGKTVAEAFAQAAIAMTAVITAPDGVLPTQSVEITCEAPDPELLLVDWLNALIYEMATRHMLFSRFNIEIEGERLKAVAWGEPIDLEKHQPAVEIKGATYTELEVSKGDDGRWQAQCVVDV